MPETNLFTWSEQLPDKPGKYIVKTVSKLLKTEHVMFSTLSINDKGEKSWSFRNQLFKSYLKPLAENDSIEDAITELLNKADEQTNTKEFNQMSLSIIDYIDSIERSKK